MIGVPTARPVVLSYKVTVAPAIPVSLASIIPSPLRSAMTVPEILAGRYRPSLPADLVSPSATVSTVGLVPVPAPVSVAGVIV